MLQLFSPRRTPRETRRPRPAARPTATHPGLSLLVSQGRIEAEEASRAAAEAGERREPLPATLVRLRLIQGRDWAGLMTQHYGIEHAPASEFPETPVLADLFSPRFLRQSWILPLQLDEERVWLGMADPADEAAIRAVKLAAGREVVPVVVTVEDLEAAYQRFYETGRSALQQIVDDIAVEPGGGSGTIEADVEQLKDRAQEAPVIRLVNQILTDALRMQASDVHIEPFRDRLQVRYRVHGRLREIGAPPASLGAAVISRIKILARLDIAERRLPQDGRSQITIAGRRVDLRVATMPTIHGESLVIRLLDQEGAAVELSSLGLDPAIEAALRQELAAPHGMLLVTGPTGSGKTTTLYAALRQLDAHRDKIISIEDPIEYQIDGLTQIQVKPEIDLTFARILRSVVRHDPNIIMVGETRDAETADIAVHAALTGHLLLSTLHTNSAAGAVARLLDMEVEPYLLASVLRSVIGQRLVGVLCDHCKAPYEASIDERHFFAEAGIGGRSNGAPLVLHKAVGCRHCDQVGFVGRVGIFEMLKIDEPVRQLIRSRASAQEIFELAANRGMRTMFQDGLVKAADGVTTFEEVCRVTEDW